MNKSQSLLAGLSLVVAGATVASPLATDKELLNNLHWVEIGAPQSSGADINAVSFAWNPIHFSGNTFTKESLIENLSPDQSHLTGNPPDTTKPDTALARAKIQYDASLRNFKQEVGIIFANFSSWRIFHNEKKNSASSEHFLGIWEGISKAKSFTALKSVIQKAIDYCDQLLTQDKLVFQLSNSKTQTIKISSKDRVNFSSFVKIYKEKLQVARDKCVEPKTK